MRIKKIIAGILFATMLFSTSAVFADNTDKTLQEFAFGSFTATVKEINDYGQVKGSKFISLEDKEGFPINMIVSKETYIVGDKEIAVGDLVTGYYNANAPMILIYPPQYNVELVVIEKGR